MLLKFVPHHCYSADVFYEIITVAKVYCIWVHTDKCSGHINYGNSFHSIQKFTHKFSHFGFMCLSPYISGWLKCTIGGCRSNSFTNL